MKFYTKTELEYGIKAMFYILKDLKFDIIKSKGKPIKEKVYFQLYYNSDNKKFSNIYSN